MNPASVLLRSRDVPPLPFASEGRHCCLLLWMCLAICRISVFAQAPRPWREGDIHSILEEMKSRLGITQDVEVVIAAGNSRLVSVERVPDCDGFRISFEEGFLRTLDEQELRAALAHELGHVWIFTHFPFLHTEALANEQALKLVEQAELDKLYERAKQWRLEKPPIASAVPAVD